METTSIQMTKQIISLNSTFLYFGWMIGKLGEEEKRRKFYYIESSRWWDININKLELPSDVNFTLVENDAYAWDYTMSLWRIFFFSFFPSTLTNSKNDHTLILVYALLLRLFVGVKKYAIPLLIFCEDIRHAPICVSDPHSRLFLFMISCISRYVFSCFLNTQLFHTSFHSF